MHTSRAKTLRNSLLDSAACGSLDGTAPISGNPLLFSAALSFISESITEFRVLGLDFVELTLENTVTLKLIRSGRALIRHDGAVEYVRVLANPLLAR